MRARRVLERTAIRWAALALAAAVLLALGGGLDAPAAGAKSPPGKVSTITITRADGTLTASWDAVSGATSYHVTYSSDGAHSWTLAAFGHTSTSITISHAVNPNTYIVAVRARNEAGWGGWVNSAPAGPYSPGTSLPPDPPATPASVTVTRGEGVLYASWPAVSNATSYHVTYTYVFDRDGARKWWAAATHHTTNSITIPHVWNGEQYVVAVRARNADGESGWRQSPLSPIYFSDIGIPDPPASVTVTRTNGSIVASWPAVTHASSYHVDYSNDGGTTFYLHAVDHTSTSITIDANNSRVYIVGVESVNGNGVSARTQSASSPPFFAHRPSWVKVTRTDGALTATWPPASGATKYHVTYSSDGGHSWTLGAYGATATSLDISGADNDASYIVGVRAGNDNGWSAWRNSPSAGPYTAPPATPTGLAVAPGEGFLGITWNAVASATGYDIRAKMQGASDWHDVAGDVSATSYNYSTTTTMDYVAVRARNSGGESDWAEVSRLPSAELLSTASGQAAGGGGVSGQAAGLVMAMALSGGEVSAQSNEVSGQSKLAAPTWSTINRNLNRQKADIDLSWTASQWATGYNLVCSDTNGWTWNICGWDDNGTVTYTSVPVAETLPVKVTHFRRGSDSPHPPGDHQLRKNRFYTIAVRAVNANPADASDWVNTQVINPIFPILSDFTWTRTDNQITMSWTPNFWTTGYKVYCDNYTPGGTYNPSYTLCATLTNQDDTAATHSVTIAKSGAAHNWSSIDNTSTLDIKIVSTNATGEGEWLTPLMAAGKTLSTSNVSATGATLTLYGHTGGWWYKGGVRNGASGNCTPVTGSTSVTLSTLTANQTYEYHAYSAAGCASANLIATAIFRTVKSGSAATIALTNVTQTTARAELKNRTGAWWYAVDPRRGAAGPCTTGQTSSYVASLSGLDHSSPYTFTAYSDSSCSTEITNVGFSTKSDTIPAELTASNVGVSTARLTIDRHTAQWWYKANVAPHTTCQGPVAANTASKDLTGLSANTSYTYTAYSATGCASANELATAAAFTTLSSVSSLGSSRTGDSSIGSSLTKQAVAFTTGSNTGGYILKTVTIPLKTAGGSGSGLTVTLQKMQGTGSYNYFYSVPSSTVQATLTGTAPTSGSYANTTWTCSGSGCDLDPSAVYFIVANRTASANYAWSQASSSSVTRSPSNNGWNIRYGHDYAASANIWSSTGLEYNVAQLVFANGSNLTASGVTQTGATLTIAEYTGDWYYKANTGPHTACQGPVSTTTVTLSGLTGATPYTYSAYSDSGCTAANRVASEAFTTLSPPTLTASNVGATSATLTIANHTAQWWYKANVAPHTTCQGPVAANTATKDLTGLTAGAAYTYKAYSATGCASANLLATAGTFTMGVSVSNLSETTHSTQMNPGSGRSLGQGFTTGSAAGGYALVSVTLDFVSATTPANFSAAIHDSQSNGKPATTARATLTGTAASGQVKFTCSSAGTGCQLAANTTYFVYGSATSFGSVLLRTTTSDSQALLPSGNGWSIANAVRGEVWTWNETVSGYSLKVGLEALARPSLTSSSVSGSGATLTLSSEHSGSWYYKATTAPHTTCQGPVSTSSVTLTGLNSGTSYTYSAYSDSTCTNANKLATAAAFTTPLSAPTGLNLSFNGGILKMQATWSKPSGVTGAISYEVQHADSDRNNPYGNRRTVTSSDSTVTHTFDNSLTVKFRVRTKIGSATSAWAEYVSP